MIKLFKNLKPYIAMVIATVIFVALQSIGDLYLPTLMSEIINEGVMQGDTNRILQIGGLMLLVAGGGVVCSIIASLL